MADNLPETYILPSEQVIRRYAYPLIKELITAKGLTIAGFAQSIGITRSYISQIINGLRAQDVPEHIKNKIARGLELSKDVIFNKKFAIQNQLGVGAMKNEPPRSEEIPK